MVSSIVVLTFIPWLDTSRVRSAKYRPIFRWFFWFFGFTCLALGYLGAMPAEQPYIWWAQIFTVCYFAFFLLVMPIVGIIETPGKLPRSITEDVLGKNGGGGMPAGAAAGPEKR